MANLTGESELLSVRLGFIQALVKSDIRVILQNNCALNNGIKSVKEASEESRFSLVRGIIGNQRVHLTVNSETCPPDL